MGLSSSNFVLDMLPASAAALLEIARADSLPKRER
jgi:hypothetical protein